MSYNPDREKEKIIKFLSNNYNYKLDKKQVMNNAVLFANDQLEEVRMKIDQFIDSVSHLDVYKHLISNKFEKGIENLFYHAKNFIEHDYTEEELSNMSKREFDDIVNGQKKRYELLKIIAKKYFSI